MALKQAPNENKIILSLICGVVRELRVDQRYRSISLFHGGNKIVILIGLKDIKVQVWIFCLGLLS